MLTEVYTPPPPRKRRYLEVVEYCKAIFAETGQVPSYSMIRDVLGLDSNATVRRYVHQAAGFGLIELNEYKGGRGPRGGQRIQLGRPEEAEPHRIKLSRDHQ